MPRIRSISVTSKFVLFVMSATFLLHNFSLTSTKVIKPLISVKYCNLAVQVINNQHTVCCALRVEADSMRQLFMSQYAD